MTSAFATAPALTPEIVLISGGTAMTATAQALMQYTKQTLHLLSPFDSGGSSASLREYLDIPAVGDLRSRLVALADPQNAFQQRAQCMAARMPTHARAADWLNDCFAAANQAQFAHTQGADIWSQLLQATQTLCQKLPSQFPWCNTSFGNLMIAAGLTELALSLSDVSQQIERALNCQGHARCISNDNLHLGATLANGETRQGQHQITGKQVTPIASPITHLYLQQHQNHSADNQVRCELAPGLARAIEQAKLVLLCPGSFYTSLSAQLLTKGLSQALHASAAKITYVPNLGCDPEMYELSPQSGLMQLENLLKPAKLNWILLDTSQTADFPRTDTRILSTHLSQSNGTRHDANKLAAAIHMLLQQTSAPSGRGQATFTGP